MTELLDLLENHMLLLNLERFLARMVQKPSMLSLMLMVIELVTLPLMIVSTMLLHEH